MVQPEEELRKRTVTDPTLVPKSISYKLLETLQKRRKDTEFLPIRELYKIVAEETQEFMKTTVKSLGENDFFGLLGHANNKLLDIYTSQTPILTNDGSVVTKESLEQAAEKRDPNQITPPIIEEIKYIRAPPTATSPTTRKRSKVAKNPT